MVSFQPEAWSCLKYLSRQRRLEPEGQEEMCAAQWQVQPNEVTDGGFSCSGSDASQKDAEAASSNDEPGSTAGDESAEDKSGQSASGIKHADLF